VSLLVRATAWSGLIVSPTMGAVPASDRHDGSMPPKQIEAVRRLAESLVRSASRPVRSARQVPAGLSASDRSVGGGEGESSILNRGRSRLRHAAALVGESCLYLPPPRG